MKKKNSSSLPSSALLAFMCTKIPRSHGEAAAPHIYEVLDTAALHRGWASPVAGHPGLRGRELGSELL